MSKYLNFYIKFSLYYSLIRNISPLDKGFMTDNFFITDYLVSILGLPIIIYYFLKKGIPKNLVFLCLTFLNICVVIGSIFVFLNNTPLGNTFISRAINTLPFYVFFYYLLYNYDTKNLMSLIEFFKKKYLVITFICGLILITYVLLGKPEFKKPGEEIYYKHIYHEEIALIVPSFILIELTPLNKLLKYILRFYFFSLGILIWKNTGFLVAITTYFGFKFYEFYRKNFSSLYRLIIYQLVFFLLPIFVLLLFFIYKTFYSILPSGSLDVRLVTYSLRIEEFLQSPLFGHLFTGTSLLEVGWLENIPSHSDFLDLLSQFGIIGIIIGIAIVYPLFNIKKHIQIIKYYPKDLRIIYLFFVVTATNILLSSIFNPIFGQNRISFFFWIFLSLIIYIQSYYPRRIRNAYNYRNA